MTIRNANSMVQQNVRTINFPGIVLAPLTKAIFTWVLQETRAASWLRSWAFQAILRQVYSRFANCYPEWRAVLFDEYFLNHNGAAWWAGYLQHQTLPQPVELATAWDEQLGPAAPAIRERRMAELTPAATDLLDWLKIELRQHPLFRRIRGTGAARLTQSRPISKQSPPEAETDALLQDKQMNIIAIEVQGKAPVTILCLYGPLNAGNYLDLIAKAKEVYEAGGRNIILDMSNISSVGISSMVALHSIAVLLQGKAPLDPEAGWDALYAVARDMEVGGLQKQFKLCNPQPQVKASLEQAGVKTFLEIHMDLETAIASF